MKLSFITPSIRPEKLETTYNSIDVSCDWEMIVIGPYKPPFVRSNVVWIEDYGHLVRARQLGLIAANGEYVTWMVDDGVYVPGALNKALSLIDGNTIVSMMVSEGGGNIYSLNSITYRAGFHIDCQLPYVPADTLMLLFGICPRKKLVEIGGWDCLFEGMGLADVDLSIRLRKIGIKEVLLAEHCVSCEWMPGATGDHGPVHHAHFENDRPLFTRIYKKEVRDKIELWNWMKAEDRWSRRFK